MKVGSLRPSCVFSAIAIELVLRARPLLLWDLPPGSQVPIPPLQELPLSRGGALGRAPGRAEHRSHSQGHVGAVSGGVGRPASKQRPNGFPSRSRLLCFEPVDTFILDNPHLRAYVSPCPRLFQLSISVWPQFPPSISTACIGQGQLPGGRDLCYLCISWA